MRTRTASLPLAGFLLIGMLIPIPIATVEDDVVSGDRAVKVTVTAPTAENWHVKLRQDDRSLYIRKSNGKMRPIGIPALDDRVVQEAIRMVLEPIYESDFLNCSYGFRPNRCTMTPYRCAIKGYILDRNIIGLLKET